jgi:photosystem II stability/assembly factor-like uncharacterized protein
MKTVGSWQLAVGSWRRKNRSLFLVTACCLLLTANCLSARAAGVWTKQRTGSFAWLHAVYFLDENRGWAVGGKGTILATDDGGNQWQELPRPTEDSLQDIYFADEQTGWLVCERNIYDLKTVDEPRTYLMHTSNGGRTWTRVNVIGKDVNVRLVRALFTTGGRGWAFGEGGVLYTTRDGGATWEPQRVPTKHLLLGGLFLNNTQGWLVGAGATILQTSDGGETWNTGALLNRAPASSENAKDAEAVAAHVRFTATSFIDQKRGWAVGAEGKIFATRDGGRRWSAQASNITADLLDVKFISEYEGWAVGAQGTLIRTMDGGAHWTMEASGTTHPLERIFFVGRAHGWIVGFGGTIISYRADGAAPQRPVLKQ